MIVVGYLRGVAIATAPAGVRDADHSGTRTALGTRKHAARVAASPPTLVHAAPVPASDTAATKTTNQLRAVTGAQLSLPTPPVAQAARNTWRALSESCSPWLAVMRYVHVGTSQLDFADFYREFRDACLFAVLVSVGDWDAAQDLVDEAFARAWASWRSVSRHPAPAAWVVRTALNASISRWRKRRREVLLPEPGKVADLATGQGATDSPLDPRIMAALTGYLPGNSRWSLCDCSLTWTPAAPPRCLASRPAPSRLTWPGPSPLCAATSSPDDSRRSHRERRRSDHRSERAT